MNAKSYKEIGIDYSMPECVRIRKCQNFMRAGNTYNGKQLIVKNGYIFVWEKQKRWFDKKKEGRYIAICKTAAEYLKIGSIRSYIVGEWSINFIRKYGKVKEVDFIFRGNREYDFLGKADDYDISQVICEAKKYGFNVDTDFMKRQLEFIINGFKVNRFSPDGSCSVFSPIRDNGIIFRFAPIAQDEEEYIA
jgi:hypothetical protein